MSDFVIYLRLKPFIAQYVKHHFGDPVRFDDHSVGNECINSVLQRRKKNSTPEVAGEGLTAVCIPYSKQKDPSVWNFVSEAGKRVIIEHIEGVFLMNMWNEMHKMCSEHVKVQSAAFAWCEMHGIDMEYADTIRMRFYRERDKLLSKGIDLRKKNRAKKKC